MEIKYMIACFVAVLAYKYYSQIDLCLETVTESSHQTKRTKVDNNANQMQSDQSGKNSYVENKNIQNKQSTSTLQTDRQNERDKDKENDEEKQKGNDCEIPQAAMKLILAIIENGKLVLFRGNRISPGQSLYLICSPKHIAVAECLPNGQFNMQLPKDCGELMKATVEKVSDSTHSGDCFRVGYRLNNDFLEIYRSYYDIYLCAKRVISQLHHSTVATDRSKTTFTTDGIISGADANTYKSSSIHQRFNQLLGRKQQYITSDDQIVIDRGHLAPAADFVHPDGKRSTFKYINTVPQFSRLNRGIWRAIENWVRQYAATTSNGLIIETGTLDEVLQLRDENGNLVDMYLGDNYRNPIPKWIYKIVKDRQDERVTFVFLLYNNIFDTELPKLPPNFEPIPCPPELAKLLEENGFVICCDPKFFFFKK